MEEVKYKNKCCVPGCTDRRSKRHRFPRNPELLKSWIKNVREPKLEKLPAATIYRSYFVCDKHFDGKYSIPGTRRGLRKDAVPTLFLSVIDENLEKEQVIEEIECDTELVAQSSYICLPSDAGPSTAKYLEKPCSFDVERTEEVDFIPKNSDSTGKRT